MERKFLIISFILKLLLASQARCEDSLSVHLSFDDVKAVNGEYLYSIPREKRLDVIVHNNSGKILKIWNIDNSWGCDSIYFKVTMSDGSSSIIKPKPQIFTVNFPGFRGIAPGGYTVFTITLDKKWENIGAIDEAQSITCNYIVNETAQSKKLEVYTGRVNSPSYSLAH